MNRSASGTGWEPTGSLEARLFRAYWDDGLLDLLFGVGTVAVGILWLVDLVVFGAIVPAFVALAWSPLRHAIVEPRAGWVEFGRARTESSRRRLQVAMWLGVGALVLVLALVVLARAGTDLVPIELAAALPAALIGTMAALIGAGLMLGRFLGYAVLFIVVGVAVALAGGEPGLAILIGGVLTGLAGTLILARFLRTTRPVDEG